MSDINFGGTGKYCHSCGMHGGHFLGCIFSGNPKVNHTTCPACGETNGHAADCYDNNKRKAAAQATTAPKLLEAAAGHMRDRASTYDKPEGERSMAATVEAFNIITGRDGIRALTESEGWLLMQTLKDVRDRQRPEPHRDSLEDGVAYAALKAEARLKESK